ncbi:SDR family NAD(P)-dependent oxidoreductase [Streptomyces echinatus]|uniref:NAD(P)-dependent dehydrogenase (Short-subunit alcohol dehydrogenase family) n=1 Tax=Streptomyces echinatus TaxID=67293 RepID=A0A7W9UVM1_9ACTN|nr:SDR family NAD(P)-dependent oxidoreductase [Streptomyces echinatus]MBB5932416.1 NAD(P)-dependent dehydrogenase (short-subunit alcohol dehydrogenase family) [Streptomyces echinatus]
MTSPTAEHARTISLVTGGNRGIGREVCRQLAALGHTVLLTSRSPASAEAAARQLARDGSSVHPLQLDVRDPDSVGAAAREVAKDFGRLDMLVNNAAIMYDTWQRAPPPISPPSPRPPRPVSTAPGAPHRPSCLLRQSPHARIVNVSSEAASLAGLGGGTPAYTITKAGLNALTLMLAAELRGDRILVNAVCPGRVATDMGGPGGRPVPEGAAGIVWAATLPHDGPTGGFYRDGLPIPW